MGEPLISYDPSNGKPLGEVEVTSTAEIHRIVDSARIAASKWRQRPIDERLRIVEQAYEGLEPHMKELATLLSREMGKDLRRASGEVQGSVFGSGFLAQAAMEALQSKDLGDGTRIEYAPLGVVALISPWNYPLAMANNLLAPALVAGNSVVFKPSEETPLVARDFVALLNKVLPEDLLQIVYGRDDQGRVLVESDVDMVAFTGSQAAGRDIMARAAGKLKRLVMELGGNDPMIVMADANVEAAARFAVANSLENAGQRCIATERIYVDSKVAAEFEKLVVELAGAYKVGPWDMEGVNIGPIVNAKQHEKIVAHIRDAESKGARVLLGGSDQPERYIGPTVLADITPVMLVEQEETFGPVVSMCSFTDLDETIARANDSDYGLGAVVFGGAGAEQVAARLEAGMIGINQGVGSSGDAPWVGAKQSGFGFHGSPEGHRQFAQVRVVK